MKLGKFRLFTRIQVMPGFLIKSDYKQAGNLSIISLTYIDNIRILRGWVSDRG